VFLFCQKKQGSFFSFQRNDTQPSQTRRRERTLSPVVAMFALFACISHIPYISYIPPHIPFHLHSSHISHTAGSHAKVHYMEMEKPKCDIPTIRCPFSFFGMKKKKKQGAFLDRFFSLLFFSFFFSPFSLLPFFLFFLFPFQLVWEPFMMEQHEKKREDRVVCLECFWGERGWW